MANAFNVQKSLDDFMQQRQKIIIGILLGLCVFGILVFFWLNQPKAAIAATRKDAPHFDNPLDGISDKIWREQQENRISEAHQQTSSIQTQLADLKQEAKIQASLLKAQTEELDRLRTQSAQKQSLLMDQQTKANVGSNLAANSAPPHILGAPGMGDSDNESAAFNSLNQHKRNHIKVNNFALTPHQAADLIHTDRNYVPAGAFVRAVLLSGLDAPTGVNNQSEPVPVLLRLVDWGKLPNDAHSHIKSCFMTAAGLGNISSERAYIRTERMSCTLNDGRILDVPIQATIVGPDGKDGVRGPVIWREQAMVERAAAAGLLSGFSNALSQAYTMQTSTPFGVASSVNNKHIFQYGLSNGAANGMDKLADYFIKRAESYQPVVEVSAGVTVDVMFLRGVSLSLTQVGNLGEPGVPPQVLAAPNVFGSPNSNLNAQGGSSNEN